MMIKLQMLYKNSISFSMEQANKNPEIEQKAKEIENDYYEANKKYLILIENTKSLQEIKSMINTLRNYFIGYYNAKLTYKEKKETQNVKEKLESINLIKEYIEAFTIIIKNLIDQYCNEIESIPTGPIEQYTEKITKILKEDLEELTKEEKELNNKKETELTLTLNPDDKNDSNLEENKSWIKNHIFLFCTLCFFIIGIIIGIILGLIERNKANKKNQENQKIKN